MPSAYEAETLPLTYRGFAEKLAFLILLKTRSPLVSVLRAAAPARSRVRQYIPHSQDHSIWPRHHRCGNPSCSWISWPLASRGCRNSSHSIGKLGVCLRFECSRLLFCTASNLASVSKLENNNSWESWAVLKNEKNVSIMFKLQVRNVTLKMRPSCSSWNAMNHSLWWNAHVQAGFCDPVESKQTCFNSWSVETGVYQSDRVIEETLYVAYQITSAT